jgi:predicted transcriptional regulator
LKRRPNILIYMEILDLLLDGPKGPSRLSQAMGLNFYKFLEFASFLKAKELIRSEVQEGHELYFITQQGAELNTDWKRVWNKLAP